MHSGDPNPLHIPFTTYLPFLVASTLLVCLCLCLCHMCGVRKTVSPGQGLFPPETVVFPSPAAGQGSLVSPCQSEGLFSRQSTAFPVKYSLVKEGKVCNSGGTRV